MGAMAPHLSLLLIVVLTNFGSFPEVQAASTTVVETAYGVALNLPHLGFRMAAEVGSASGFRLGVSFQVANNGSRYAASHDLNTPPLVSPSLDPNRRMANFTRVTDKGRGTAGVKTTFGSLVVSVQSGHWELLSPSGSVVAAAAGPPSFSADSYGGSITLPATGSKSGIGATGRRPCLTNGGWGTPYTWDEAEGWLAYAVPQWQWDPEYIHCAPCSFDGRTPPVKLNDTCTRYVFETAVNGVPLRTVTPPKGVTCCAVCNEDPDCTAWVSSRVNGSCSLYRCVEDGEQAMDKSVISGGDLGSCSGLAPPPSAHQRGWWARGSSADWYLAPTPNGGYDFTKALYQLTGAPAVPPIWGMGFMATYWGYKSMQQVEGYMHSFRNGSYPIDSFIMDYDWFGPDPCGAPNEQGGYACGDFGYRGSFWQNQSFVQPDGTTVATKTAAEVLQHFHSPPLSLRFAGIRKPRSYSNVNLSNTSGWLLEAQSNVGAGGNNWNYSVVAMREWYTKNHLHFLQDGVDYWWNDEGETQWFTYLYWNMAQQAQWTAAKPNQRHFTINRAFQPGMQRFPAITWTGDGQDCSHTNILQFQRYGQLYSACDMTSPDNTTLVRQYQNAVFLPIMRVHQMHGTPRFPFLWGGAAHQQAFREALNTRYHFLPYLYSLAHRAHRTNRPIIAPASYEYEMGLAGAGSPLDNQIMVGGDLIPADVSTGKTPDNENASTVVLPPGDWYTLNKSGTTPGSQTINATLALNEFPVYVRPGAILPLQQSVIQKSDDVGGQLLVQVYAGRSNSFVMVEDDGSTLSYTTDYAGATKSTVWQWDDAGKTLSWASTGGFAGNANTFSTVQAQLFTASAATMAKAMPLTPTGKISF
eukprot:m.173747 g.173747  ORF g.173747 m.173747 type:complete len:864 (+) comp14861_c0_seq3:88-2679(+)